MIAGACAAPSPRMGAPSLPPAPSPEPAAAAAPADTLPAIDQEPTTPITGARAFLDEAQAQLQAVEKLLEADEFRGAEYALKEALQVLIAADRLMPSRAQIEEQSVRTDQELLQREALVNLRDLFDRLWTRTNAHYDHLLPLLDIAQGDLDQLQAEERIELEEMNVAVEGDLEPPPGSWQEIRDLLMQMEQAGQLDIDMELDSYDDEAWKRVYWALEYYTGRGRANFHIWLERSGRYQRMVEDLLEEREIPRDMVYLCMIESGFSPRAYSVATATGPWQFMSATGRKYGLHTYRSNRFLDERRDYIKSTHAAASYLTDLYEEFRSWPLAMAAYNSGEGRVRGAQRWAERNGHPLGYWSIYSRLPRETRNYVPYYLAALTIGKNPARFGFANVAFQPAFMESFETVRIEGAVALDQAAELAGTTLAVMRELNAELFNQVSPPGGYLLRLPRGTTDAFIAGLEALPETGRKSYEVHVVQRGETGGQIAERWSDVTWAQIRQENNIRNDRALQVGQTLRIPRWETSRYLTEAEILSRTRVATASAGSGTPLRYQVRRGDTISGLATRYGVTWIEVRQWNNLSGNTIFAGQTLTLYPRRGAASATLPAVASAASPADGIYTIGRNDTLWDISQRFGVSVNDLQQWNNLRGSTIYPGHRLYVTREAAESGQGGSGFTSGPGTN